MKYLKWAVLASIMLTGLNLVLMFAGKQSQASVFASLYFVALTSVVYLVATGLRMMRANRSR